MCVWKRGAQPQDAASSLFSYHADAWAKVMAISFKWILMYNIIAYTWQVVTGIGSVSWHEWKNKKIMFQTNQTSS